MADNTVNTNRDGIAIKTLAVGYNPGIYGSYVSGVHNHVEPIAFAVTKELAGTPTTALDTNAYNHEDILNPAIQYEYYVRLTSTAMRSGQFNFFTGQYDPQPTVVLHKPHLSPLPVWIGQDARKYPRPMTFLAPGNVPVTVAPAGNTAQ